MSSQQERAATILAVDDVQENVHLLTSLLSPKGYAVREAFDGEQALEEVRKSPPDIILLDVMMPGLDGIEVCRRLKSDTATYHIPIIIITGVAAREANLRAIEAGADDYLTKPVDSAMLNTRIQSCLRTKLLQDQIRQYQRQLEHSNETLEEHIRERTRQLERTQHVTVFSLARLAESRDTETGEHLNRIRRYVQVLAQEMGRWPQYKNTIDAEFVKELFHSSPLHDIGKVGIPDSILLKPGKLSADEFDIMKAHTIIGGDTLKAADIEAGKGSFLTMGRDIAYYHHEKWDGNGYPFGISGEDIPLVARIVALGDCYDALTSKRPYKEAFSHQTAREIILESKASHFDPDVVDAFLAVEDQFVTIQEALRDAGGPSHIEAITKTLEDLRQRSDHAPTGSE